MKEYDKLIARLTDRLAVDPELQLDVAQELRAHLEDSEAEFSQAGLADDQAQAEATKALGDPDELAGQLWQTNRSRLRIRGLLRWAARATLIPAAIGVIVCLLIFPRGTFDVPESWADELTEKQMYILRGNPTDRTPLERAKSITDRWPKNPVYFGDYVMQARWQEKLYGRLSGAKLQRVQELLARGEKLDPDNAFYNFARATTLINSTCQAGKDKSLTYHVNLHNSKTKHRPCYTVTIQDAKLFRQGLAELRRGLAKSRFAVPSIDMLEIRKSFFPKPRNVNDVIRRIRMEGSVAMPFVNDYRNLAGSILGYALAEARKGNANGALRLVRDVEQFANHTGTGSTLLIELLIARAIYDETMGHSTQICKVLGRDDQAKQFQSRLDESRLFSHELRKQHGIDEKELRTVGMYWAGLRPNLPFFGINYEPMRTAEQFLVNKLGLLALLIALTLLAMLMGLVTWLELLRRNDRPVLLFVGWERIGKICLWAIVVPIAIYAIYVQLVTVGPDAFGMNFAAGRVILEMVFVGAVICVLLVGMSYAAIRRRSDELGLAVPQPLTFRRRRVMWPLAGLVTLGVAAYLIVWWTGYIHPGRLDWSLLSDKPVGKKSSWQFPSSEAVMISVAIAAFLLIWALREIIGLFNRRYRRFRRSVYRNIVPILAAAVIVVGIICGIVLNRAEASAARRVTGDATLSIGAEIDRSAYNKMRDQFAARRK